VGEGQLDRSLRADEVIGVVRDRPIGGLEVDLPAVLVRRGVAVVAVEPPLPPGGHPVAVGVYAVHAVAVLGRAITRRVVGPRVDRRIPVIAVPGPPDVAVAVLIQRPESGHGDGLDPLCGRGGSRGSSGFRR